MDVLAGMEGTWEAEGRVVNAEGEIVSSSETTTTCSVDEEGGRATLVSVSGAREWAFEGALCEGGGAMRFVMAGGKDDLYSASPSSYMLSRAVDASTLLNEVFVGGVLVSMELIRLAPGGGARVQQSMRIGKEGEYAGAGVYLGTRR